jgi:hypothetical protein
MGQRTARRPLREALLGALAALWPKIGVPLEKKNCGPTMKTCYEFWPVSVFVHHLSQLISYYCMSASSHFNILVIIIYILTEIIVCLDVFELYAYRINSEAVKQYVFRVSNLRSIAYVTLL